MPQTALQVDEDAAIIAEYETMDPTLLGEDLRRHGIDAQTVQNTVDSVKKRVADWERARKK